MLILIHVTHHFLHDYLMTRRVRLGDVQLPPLVLTDLMLDVEI